MLEGRKVRVARNNEKIFRGNGSGGVDSFIEANSQPKGRRKNPYAAAREYNTYKDQVKFSGKLDLSKIRTNLKNITHFNKSR